MQRKLRAASTEEEEGWRRGGPRRSLILTSRTWMRVDYGKGFCRARWYRVPRMIFEVCTRSFCFIEWVLISFTDAEQRITPWQDDATVSKCPLCTYVFLLTSGSPEPSPLLQKNFTYIPPALHFTHSRTVNTTAVSAGTSSAASHQNPRCALPLVQCSLSLMPRRGASRRSERASTTACVVQVPAKRKNSSAASGCAAPADLCSRDSNTGKSW
jgi:hypothetical protein